MWIFFFRAARAEEIEFSDEEGDVIVIDSDSDNDT